MIILNMRLLVRGIGIAEEEPCFSVTIQIIFKSEDIRKLSAVVAQKDIEQCGNGNTCLAESILKRGKP